MRAPSLRFDGAASKHCSPLRGQSRRRAIRPIQTAKGIDFDRAQIKRREGTLDCKPCPVTETVGDRAVVVLFAAVMHDVNLVTHAERPSKHDASNSPSVQLFPVLRRVELLIVEPAI